MSTRKNTDNYCQLFLGDVPLMDVRAPVEYEKGAFPSSSNIPLMHDEERHLVGIEYKNAGQDAAIALGHKLVCGNTKKKRIKAWKAFIDANPQGYLYCFRGGLRSSITQEWLDKEAIDYPLVIGGYKAMRRALIEETARISKDHPFIVVAGRTGSGKTLLIDKLPFAVDLEDLANHRGSSFGRSVDDHQPSQIDFENRLAIALMKKEVDANKQAIFIEDESQRIGRLSIPIPMIKTMSKVPMVLVEENTDVRIENILKDYVTDMVLKFEGLHGEEGFRYFSQFLLDSLKRIKKRLGGVVFSEIENSMKAALKHQHLRQDETLHRKWIESLLREYYDPMYDYQLSKKSQTIIFTGPRSEILEKYGTRA